MDYLTVGTEQSIVHNVFVKVKCNYYKTYTNIPNAHKDHVINKNINTSQLRQEI